MPQQPEKIAGGYKATAGPLFSRRGFLLFSDPPEGRILKWEKGKITVFRQKSNGAKGNTFDHQGRLLTCETGRVTRTEKGGKIEILASGIKSPADVVYAIDGSIYFCDPPAGLVYQVTRSGELRKAAECPRPEGVAMAPNQQRLFVSDAGARNVRVHDIAGDGALSEGRVFATVDDRPGGLKTDESGAVWVACAGGIRQFDKSGRPAATIALPEPAANCNWGEGFHDLFVTAGRSVYRVEAKVNGTRTY